MFRQLGIGAAVLLNSSAMLHRADYLNFLAALTAFAAGGACFAVNRTLLRGWGHSLFHLFLCVYTYHVLNSAHGLAVVLHRAAVAQTLAVGEGMDERML